MRGFGVRTEDGHRRAAPPAVVASVEGDRVTAVELFFDLAYVFGFTQVSRLMAEAHSPVGVLQGIVVLALLWWSWTAYSWLANQMHADEGVVRTAMFVGMMAVFVAAVVVPEAFGDHSGGLSGPLVFVAAYLVARLAHLVVYLVASVGGAGARREVVRTVCFSLVPSGGLLLAGALSGAPWQVWCALAAVVIEPIVAGLTTTSGVRSRISSAAHFVERYRLVVILALGESTVAIGAAAGALDLPMLAGVLLTVAIAIALWRAYFVGLSGAAEHAMAELGNRARSRAAQYGYSMLHFPIVAGIVLSALGIEVAMAHVADAAPLGWFGGLALAGGVWVYLVGTALFARQVAAVPTTARLIAAGVMITSSILISHLAPLAALAVVAVLLPTVLLADRVALRRYLERRTATAVA